MDIELINIINYIRSIKQEQYMKYKPELINGKNLLSNKTLTTPQNDSSNNEQPKAYIRLMQKQRQLVYKNNIEEQINAEKKDLDKTQINAEKRYLDKTQDMNAEKRDLDKTQDMMKTNKIKIMLKCQNSPITDTTDSHNELCKPWPKIPNNLKIQSVLKFIEDLIPQLTNEQKNQLRFLLISSISQKKLMKQSDVEYDSTNGYLLRINKLSYDGENFLISEASDKDHGHFPFKISPTQNKKKFTLIKK